MSKPSPSPSTSPRLTFTPDSDVTAMPSIGTISLADTNLDPSSDWQGSEGITGITRDNHTPSEVTVDTTSEFMTNEGSAFGDGRSQGDGTVADNDEVEEHTTAETDPEQDIGKYMREIISNEVWEKFRERREPLQQKMEALSEAVAIKIEARQQGIDNTTDDDEIAKEVEEEFRPERNYLQSQIDGIDKEMEMERERRYDDFERRGYQNGLVHGQGIRETSDDSFSIEEVTDGSDAGIESEDGNEEVNVDPEFGVGEVEVDFQVDVKDVDGSAANNDTEVDARQDIKDEAMAEGEKTNNEGRMKCVSEEPSIAPVDEQIMRGPVPASSNETYSETDSAEAIAHVNTSLAQEKIADHMVSRQTSAESSNTGFPDDNTLPVQGSGPRADGQSSNLDGGYGVVIPIDDCGQHPSILSRQQAVPPVSNETESQAMVVFEEPTAARDPHSADSQAMTGEMDAAENAAGAEAPASSSEATAPEETEATDLLVQARGSDPHDGQHVAAANRPSDASASHIPANNTTFKNVSDSNAPNTVSANTVPTNLVRDIMARYRARRGR